MKLELKCKKRKSEKSLKCRWKLSGEKLKNKSWQQLTRGKVKNKNFSFFLFKIIIIITSWGKTKIKAKVIPKKKKKITIIKTTWNKSNIFSITTITATRKQTTHTVRSAYSQCIESVYALRCTANVASCVETGLKVTRPMRLGLAWLGLVWFGFGCQLVAQSVSQLQWQGKLWGEFCTFSLFIFLLLLYENTLQSFINFFFVLHFLKYVDISQHKMHWKI